MQIRYHHRQGRSAAAASGGRGQATPADMLITVDAGNLWHAAERVLAEISSPVLEANVPANLRDPQGAGWSFRACTRTIVYSANGCNRAS